jgi:glutaredoxin 3
MKNILVYGRQDCVYCDKTKSYLDNLSMEYQYVDITFWSKEQREELKLKYSVKTVPVVIIDGKCVGGYTELTQQLHLV